MLLPKQLYVSIDSLMLMNKYRKEKKNDHTFMLAEKP